MPKIPGLSPRVRGNRNEGCLVGAVEGSIPACTGEPSGKPRRITMTGVYPRVYGGTQSTPRLASHVPGLSPRVRGNRNSPRFESYPPGSIPACTGEPEQHHAVYAADVVYPRVYGGTQGKVASYMAKEGLSPRVRGNRKGDPPVPVQERSIPACTGEPNPNPTCLHPCAVYPRVYGGTEAIWSS